MAAQSPWPVIHAEREALADDLAALTDEQWAMPSLCGDWTVRQVLAHMTATARMTPVKFFAAFAGTARWHQPGTARWLLGDAAAEEAGHQARADDRPDRRSAWLRRQPGTAARTGGRASRPRW
jgi:uncharacterized protein (TIGR03083 family)